MILRIIEDIKNSYKETPQQLYSRLIKERLELALKSYYHDIDLKASYVINSGKDSLSIMKKVIK